MRECMIRFIREYQWYPQGALESKDDDELKDIYERVLDWVIGC